MNIVQNKINPHIYINQIIQNKINPHIPTQAQPYQHKAKLKIKNT